MSHISPFRALLPAMAAGGLLLAACSGRNSYVNTEGLIWNTAYHITFNGPQSLADSVLMVLDSVGRSLNVFDSTSLVSRVNRADSLPVDRNFSRVYLSSRAIHEMSEGMFDPTLSPLITAWGFGKGHTLSADTASIDSVMTFVGLGKTRLKGETLVKEDRRTQFNFSAIAKGFGCDKVAEMLLRNGVEDYLVEIGGEIAAGGNAPGRSGWRISIDRPVESVEGIHENGMIVNITGCGLATSGNYRNFHKEGGKTIGHTISPVSGRPVQTDVLSATVVAPSCMEADAAATACMALGSDKAMTFLSKTGFDGMLILSDSTVATTAGFDRLIVK